MFISKSLGTNTIIIGEISANSLVLVTICQFPLTKFCHGFDRHEFWGLISGHVVHGKFAPQCNDIQNLTLRLMHKWVAITLFLRDDPRLVRNNELMILYAMVNKIRVSPAKAMVN